MKLYKIVMIASLIIQLLMVPISFAQTAETGKPPELPTSEIKLPGGEQNVNYFTQTFIPKIFGAMIAGVGVFGLIFILIGGVQFLTSYGNEQSITSAKKTLIYAIIGTIVALLSYTIITIINNLEKFFPN